MRSTAPGRTLSTWLLLVAGLGGLAYAARTARAQPALPNARLLLQMLLRLGQVALPLLLLVLGLLALGLVLALLRNTWRQELRTTYERAWQQAERQARDTVLQQVRMLEHAHLKSAVTEAQALLHEAIAAADPAQQTLWLRDVEHSLHRLRRLIVELHSQVAQATSVEASGSALPANLERTLVEVTRNFRKLVPRCTLEVAGQPRTAIPEPVRSALELGLYNALSNAYTHGQAQLVAVRLEYRLAEVVLSVRDNGCGFDPARIGQARRGRGLRDMAQLAERQGGSVAISSAPGRGTDVTISLPLARPALGWATTPAEPNDRDRGESDGPTSTYSALDACDGAGAAGRAAPHPDRGRHGDRARARERSAQPPWLRTHRG